MSHPVPDPLRWEGRSATESHSRLFRLDPAAGVERPVHVREDEVALLLRDAEVESCLGEGLHALRGEAGLSLLFLHASELPAVSSEFDGFRLNTRTRIDLPERFYELFLRHSDGLTPPQLNDLLQALVADCGARWMSARGHLTAAKGLAHELEIAVGAALASCGLELIRQDLLPESPTIAAARLHPV